MNLLFKKLMLYHPFIVGFLKLEDLNESTLPNTDDDHPFMICFLKLYVKEKGFESMHTSTTYMIHVNPLWNVSYNMRINHRRTIPFRYVSRNENI